MVNLVSRDTMKRHLVTAPLLAAACLVSAGSLASLADPPRQILQITVDALRGDLPSLYAHLLGDGGFRYLMEQGIYYNNARYEHANKETIVGHA